VHLRGKIVDDDRDKPVPDPERLAMGALAKAFSSRRNYERAQRLGRAGQWPFVRRGRIEHLPGPLRRWTLMRDLPQMPSQTFREWWRAR